MGRRLVESEALRGRGAGAWAPEDEDDEGLREWPGDVLPPQLQAQANHGLAV